MPRRELQLPLDRKADVALVVQIARRIADHVRHGRLRAGERLPGSRHLARTLGVHRNTVVAAYHELQLEGWITSHPARGTFVSREMPEPAPRAFGPAVRGGALPHSRAPFSLRPGPDPWLPLSVAPGVALAGGKPDLALVPV